MTPADRWFVYIARCSDGSLYTGIARDVSSRIAAHNAGRGARYTRGRGPLALCAQRRCGSKGDALRLESAVKGLARRQKETLLEVRRLAAFARRLRAGTPTQSTPPGRRARSEPRRGTDQEARDSG